LNTSHSRPIYHCNERYCCPGLFPEFISLDTEHDDVSEALIQDTESEDDSDASSLDTEHEEYTITLRKLDISDEQLFDMTMSPDSILQIISWAIPALSSTSDDMVRLHEAIQQHVAQALPLRLPKIHESPTV
jgi:hypothetical protein